MILEKKEWLAHLAIKHLEEIDVVEDKSLRFPVKWSQLLIVSWSREKSFLHDLH